MIYDVGENGIRVVAVGCTHEFHYRMEIPECDVFIHTGDFTNRGGQRAIANFNDWLKDIPAKHKVVVAGNHDFDIDTKKYSIENAIYLEDQVTDLEGLAVYGSPWTPIFFNWAFMLPRNSPELQEKWDRIPSKVDILVTHGPAFGFGNLDLTQREGLNVGCDLLRNKVLEVKPKLHLFSHIHEGRGVYHDMESNIVFANVSALSYSGFNKEVMEFRL